MKNRIIRRLESKVPLNAFDAKRDANYCLFEKKYDCIF